MQFRFFLVPVHASQVDELNRFLATHRVTSIERQFVSDGANSFWSICVTYERGDAPQTPIQQKERIDYRDHDILRKLLRRRLKGAGTLELVHRIIDAYGDGNGRGLPIGALTSQWFANYYLGPLDRFLLEQRRVAGMVRYMDDFVFWGTTREEVRSCVDGVDEFLSQNLKLESRPPTLINRSSHGVTVCGYRVFPGTIHLSRTRQDRFTQALTHWESERLAGRINSLGLQRRIDATLGMTADADARNWIGECVQRHSRSDEIDRLDAISLRISHNDE